MFNATAVKSINSDLKIGIDQVSYRLKTYESMIANGQTLTIEESADFENWKKHVDQLEYDAQFMLLIMKDKTKTTRATRLINTLLPKK